ncbi:hypothetical protein L873DRAFT_1813408 [Choiromyces venosus 120613-1]|uniref:Uncharacterized protein n=1 Tax=Choiromyces venosus 120613-1 TaxID=1336337 RepID=A0A3N4J9T7_9PEZI|nr:hypothetical protein L873DRAFT_1813408 [Choiromyces venosus 120613-1]
MPSLYSTGVELTHPGPDLANYTSFCGTTRGHKGSGLNEGDLIRCPIRSSDRPFSKIVVQYILSNCCYHAGMHAH